MVGDDMAKESMFNVMKERERKKNIDKDRKEKKIDEDKCVKCSLNILIIESKLYDDQIIKASGGFTVKIFP